MKKIIGALCASVFLLTACNSGGGQSAKYGNLSSKAQYGLQSYSIDNEVYALNKVNQQVRTSFNLEHSPILIENKYSGLYYDCKYQLGRIRQNGGIEEMMTELYSRHVANCGEYSVLASLSILHDLIITIPNAVNYNIKTVYAARVQPGDHAFAIAQGQSDQLYIVDPMFNMVQPIKLDTNGFLAKNYWKIDNNFFYDNSVITYDIGMTQQLQHALLANPYLMKLMERDAIKSDRKIKGLSELNDSTIDRDFNLDAKRVAISSINGMFF